MNATMTFSERAAVVHSYAARSARGHLEPFEYDPGQIGPDEVDVRVTHCGICYIDVALVDNDWGITHYPLVPGHEVVGIVSAVGSNVDGLRIGQRVGVGGRCGSCMQWEWCDGGMRRVFPDAASNVFDGCQGGFATQMRASNRQFVYPLPREIASEDAGPLMCAGTTVFTPLLKYGVQPTDRVAVVGVGGLGHLAVQYLAKWGCDVTAINSTHDKDEQAYRLGAKHFIATRGADELWKAAGSFDFILCTVSTGLPWNQYIAALRPQGKLCIVGIPDKPIAFGAMGLIDREKSVGGGRPGSAGDTTKMLAFTARHGIKPMIETFPMADADRALDHTRQGNAHFRAVLVA
jgi:alcohol/geraniol dehydrogenase (NADP+)